jgi:acyl-CoA thioester hydrolase
MTQRTLVFELDLPIRWGDMDAMGHVNNTVYFRYMEQCRIDWFTERRIMGSPTGLGPVIVNARCDFLKQLEYPGTVRCRMYVADIGRSSFDTLVDLGRSDEPDVVYATGGARVVWVDYRARKSVPLPAEVREAITRAQDRLL